MPGKFLGRLDGRTARHNAGDVGVPLGVQSAVWPNQVFSNDDRDLAVGDFPTMRPHRSLLNDRGIDTTNAWLPNGGCIDHQFSDNGRNRLAKAPDVQTAGCPMKHDRGRSETVY